MAFLVGAADTPSRARSGATDDDAMPVASCEAIARQALDQLPHGPVYVAPEDRSYFASITAMPRREAAELQRDLLVKMLPQAD